MVDADEFARAMYAYALSASGFDVLFVDGGRQIHRRACEVRPHAIVFCSTWDDDDSWMPVRAAADSRQVGAAAE
jgi:DNA-binding response OmpR family regulator